MKVTKSYLKQIIREELGVIHHRLQLLDANAPPLQRQEQVEEPTNLDTNYSSLWSQLNDLLEAWRPTEAEGIKYKEDLQTLMNDFLRSPDLPSPDAPESDGEESDVSGEEEIEEARGEKTPEEVKYYAEKVKGKLPKTDPKTGKPSSPYAVAWKTARQPGSKGGRKVMGRKK